MAKSVKKNVKRKAAGAKKAAKPGGGSRPPGKSRQKAAHQDFYRKLRTQIRKWAKTKMGKSHKFAEYVLLAPDFFWLLCRLMTDKDVPTAEKAKLVAVAAYFVSPLDLLPEALMGPLGYADDIALTAWVLNGLLNKVDAKVIRRHWAGEGDVLVVIKKVVRAADDMVGGGLWKKLKKLFGS